MCVYNNTLCLHGQSGFSTPATVPGLLHLGGHGCWTGPSFLPCWVANVSGLWGGPSVCLRLCQEGPVFSGLEAAQLAHSPKGRLDAQLQQHPALLAC